jgi:hypothetical protein
LGISLHKKTMLDQLDTMSVFCYRLVAYRSRVGSA